MRGKGGKERGRKGRGGEVFPIMDYMGMLCPKGDPFSG